MFYAHYELINIQIRCISLDNVVLLGYIHI